MGFITDSQKRFIFNNLIVIIRSDNAGHVWLGGSNQGITRHHHYNIGSGEDRKLF